MKKPEFTDQELNVISMICTKVDPLQMIDQTKSILEKIQAYAEGQQKEQIDKAAKAAVGED